MSAVRFETISANEENQRIDNYLIRILKGVPKSHIYRLIRNGEVRINSKRAKPSTKVTTGDVIRIPPVKTNEEKSVTINPNFQKKLEKAIIYEDNMLLVVNKPFGIAVHGGSGLSLGLIEAMRIIRQDLHYLELAHRLDKETSGCLILAKKRSALRLIQSALLKREVIKKYWVIAHNSWDFNKNLVLDKALQKNTLKSGERVVNIDAQGKASLTEFKLLQNFKNYCLLEATPKTGRTHQIRVHCSFLNHPIVGDEKYNTNPLFKKKNTRMYLHAHSIEFMLNDKKYFFEVEVDDNFAAFLQKQCEVK